MTPGRAELVSQAQAAFQEVVWHGRIRFQTLARHHGLSTPQASVLLFIHRNGPDTTMTECAAALQLPSSSVTSIVARLVQLGLVQGGTRKDDRRMVSAALTDEGAELVRVIEGQHRESFSRLLDEVADAEVAQLSEILEAVCRAMSSRQVIAPRVVVTGPDNRGRSEDHPADI